MEALRSFSLAFFAACVIALTAVGTMDCVNWIRLGLVTRPALITVQDPEEVGQPTRFDVQAEGRRAQGIPEGRLHK